MRFRCALLLLLAVAAAKGGDAPAPPADSISATKKDLAAVKALGSPAEASGSSLPTVDLKAVSPGPGGERIEAPALTPAADEASLDPSRKRDKGATGNWLVDAMERKPEKARAGTGRDGLSRADGDLLREGDRAALREDQDARGSQEPGERAGPKDRSAGAYNPLDAFMAGWISARDRDLLLPAKGYAAGGGEPARPRQGGFQDVGAASAEFTIEGLLSPADFGEPGGQAAQPNPYLASPDLSPAPGPRAFSSPQPPATTAPGDRAAPFFFGAQPDAIDAPRSFIPDFARPSEDDKYFKQMKRF
jgi:hypothetical protein